MWSATNSRVGSCPVRTKHATVHNGTTVLQCYLSYDFSVTVSVTVNDFFHLSYSYSYFFQLLLQLLDFSLSVTVIFDQIGVNLMCENNNM